MWIIIKNWLSETWQWFKSFFSEEYGPSTTRALNWIWMICLCGNLTFLTMYGTLKTKIPTLPPLEATSGYVAITSLLLAAKVGQRIWGENPVTGQTDASGSMYSTIYSNMLASIAAQYSGSVSGSNSVPTVVTSTGSNGITVTVSSNPIVYTPNTGSNSVSIP